MNKKKEKSFKSKALSWLIDNTLGTILGISIGIFLAVGFPDLTYSVMKYTSKFIHYIDTKEPVIVRIFPDVSGYANPFYELPTSFTIRVSDKESGIDLKKSYVSIWIKENAGFKEIKSEIKKSESLFVIKPLQKMNYGEYKINLKVYDKGNNSIEKSYSFIVKKKENFYFSIKCRPYNEKKDSLFSDFFEGEYVPPKEWQKYFLVFFTMANDSEKAIIRDVNFSLDTGFVIYSSVEIRNHGVKNIHSYSPAEQMVQFPKDRAFMSQRFFNIDKMAPKGFFQVCFLGGQSYDLISHHPHEKVLDHPLPTEMMWVGTYDFEGYGIRDINKSRKYIPIEYSHLKEK